MPYIPPPPPQGVQAASVLVVDDGSGKVLFARNADTPRFPASTTKIMTGLLLAERLKPGDIVTAPKGIEKIEPSKMGLKSGERLSAKALLTGIMLRSANDGCVVAAKRMGGSIPGFAKLMNARARELGCLDTNFVTPNGLHDSRHVTTARDLVTMGRAAMRNPFFAEIVGTRKAVIERSINQREKVLYNRNRWLQKDPTAEGIKTGWTTPARNTYVGAVRRSFRMVDAILRTESYMDDHKALVDWTYDTYTKGRAFPAGEAMGEYEVADGATTVSVAPTEEAYLPRAFQDPEATVEVRVTATAPISVGQTIGVLILTDASGFERTVPVVALTETPVSWSARARTGSPWLGGLLVGGLLIRRRTGTLRSVRKPAPRGAKAKTRSEGT